MSFRTIETVEGSPTFAALNPNTSKIYISYESPDVILIVNIKKGVIEDKISANHAEDIDITSSADKVYVSGADGVYEIDGSTNEYNLINKKPKISSQYQGIQDSPSSLKEHLSAVDSTTKKIYVSKYEDESISVYNGNEPNKLEDTINFKASKWDPGTSTKPSFVLVNEDLGLLYVQADGTASAGGGGGAFTLLLAVDLNTKKIIKRVGLPSTRTQLGFAFNRNNNTIYMRKSSQKAIMKFDGYLKKVHKTTFEKTSIWKRLITDYTYFAEVIVINPETSKVYVSDSKSQLLYEVDG